MQFSVLLVLLAFCAAVADVENKKQKIKHVVVLMMENRSFDHMLGYMKGVDGVPANQECPVRG